MKCLVTGGAGFIGSHIVDRLLTQGNQVVVFDNFSTGKEMYICHHNNDSNFSLIRADLEDLDLLISVMKGVDFVYHLAGHADVRSGVNDHEIDHVQNLEMTRNVLEAMYRNNVKNIMFASTSSVYGDATIHPTPEDYPFEPTSLYGASKAACESYIKAYSSYYGINAYIFRFVSFVGERSTHGITIDLLKKLKINANELELLSDGTPRKSSIYIKDGIEAIFSVINRSKEQFNIFNIGHDEITTVANTVDWIIGAAGYKNVKKIWLGKESNWKGDNEFVLLSNEKLKRFGWKPTISIKEGTERTARYILDNSII